MQTENKYPFTKKQFDALTEEQTQVLDAVAGFLTDIVLSEGTDLTDEFISETFNLLRLCEGCVPEEELWDDISCTIRKKFCAVYQVGMELAERELPQRGFKERDAFSFCIVVEPDYGDSTHVAVLDYNKPTCYLHEWNKAWNLGFSNLAALADEVLRIKSHLVEQVVNHCTKKHVFIVLDGGLVQKIVGLPDGLHATVLDYDVEDANQEHLQVSPIDGKLCYITSF